MTEFKSSGYPKMRYLGEYPVKEYNLYCLYPAHSQMSLTQQIYMPMENRSVVQKMKVHSKMPTMGKETVLFTGQYLARASWHGRCFRMG